MITNLKIESCALALCNDVFNTDFHYNKHVHFAYPHACRAIGAVLPPSQYTHSTRAHLAANIIHH